MAARIGRNGHADKKMLNRGENDWRYCYSNGHFDGHLQ